jgi:hypothetical protein
LKKKRDNDKNRGNKIWDVMDKLKGTIPKIFNKLINTPISNNKIA